MFKTKNILSNKTNSRKTSLAETAEAEGEDAARDAASDGAGQQGLHGGRPPAGDRDMQEGHSGAPTVPQAVRNVVGDLLRSGQEGRHKVC